MTKCLKHNCFFRTGSCPVCVKKSKELSRLLRESHFLGKEIKKLEYENLKINSLIDYYESTKKK